MERFSGFRLVPRIIMGRGSISVLPAEISVFGKSALLVIDAAVAEKASVKQAVRDIGRSGIKTAVFSGVEPEPWVETADEAGRIARESASECVVGIGGGSVMDVAKAAAVLAVNPGKASDYQGLDLVKRPGIPKIMAPTTAGTGSEATFTAVLSRKNPLSKAGINSPHLFPEVAVLDSELTETLPPMVTATTGMDALTHAIESFTSKQATVLSDVHAKESIRLIAGSIQAAADGDKNARHDMLIGSFLGGVSLANAGVGAVHALAYPLGGSFRIAHGVSNGLLLPHVMKFNLDFCRDKYAEIAVLFKAAAPGEDPASASEKAVLAVENLASSLKIPLKLSELGIGPGELPGMAKAAMNVTRPLENNPREVSEADAVKVYNSAL